MENPIGAEGWARTAVNYAFAYEKPIGQTTILENRHGITKIIFGPLPQSEDAALREMPLPRRMAEELREYFAGSRKDFAIPLDPSGTEFQKKVWNAHRHISYRETRSYGEIARMIGNEKACWAVGRANYRNPLAIVVPCHRVIEADGSMMPDGI
ncbi:methylated-DNA--[protein]-cysteine S-methyltransferase [Guopingia tenuis]|uniref:methylated-DNA--[protein]-cysteine S-methyltransferase n=1 Tax=Guopingia tenuis TaxID=2763656 RepID=UPI002ED56250